MITVDCARLALGPGDQILDIGCGSGRHCDHVARIPGTRVIGADPGFADLLAATDRMRYLQDMGECAGTWAMVGADITALPFADQCFDAVIASEVLEHIPHHHQAVAELVRVLKPGGGLAVSVPRYWPERICWALSRAYYQAQGGHVRIYRKGELIQMLTRTGLRLWGIHYAHAFHAPFWWLKCLPETPIQSRLVGLYHRFLVWELFNKPRFTRWLERVLNPVLGKSIVFYLKKER